MALVMGKTLDFGRGVSRKNFSRRMVKTVLRWKDELCESLLFVSFREIRDSWNPSFQKF